jgi:hypothetical protein
MKDTLGDFKRLPKDNTVPIIALGAIRRHGADA